MIYSCKLGLNNRAYPRFRIWICPVGLTALLLVSILTFIACDPSTTLIIENKMPTDIVIFHEDINSEGKSLGQGELGKIPANQTAETHYAIFLGTLGETVIIRAEDSSGNIVWQKNWTADEFLELVDEGWKIVVSPETDS